MKITDFSIGDRVRIRDWDDMAEEFGVDEWGDISCTCTFTSEMDYLCGREFVITEIRLPAPAIQKGLAVGKVDGRTISTDMIEPISSESVPTYTKEELYTFLFTP